MKTETFYKTLTIMPEPTREATQFNNLTIGNSCKNMVDAAMLSSSVIV